MGAILIYTLAAAFTVFMGSIWFFFKTAREISFFRETITKQNSELIRLNKILTEHINPIGVEKSEKEIVQKRMDSIPVYTPNINAKHLTIPRDSLIPDIATTFMRATQAKPKPQIHSTVT